MADGASSGAAKGAAPGTPRGPLAGIRVVEVAGLVAGPWTGKLLADYGADVVKVEPPAGDPLRALDADFFDNMNTSKRGVVLDLESAAGRAELATLAARADVIVEDLAPGRLAGLIGDPWAANPALVVASITPFGQDGPHAGWKGGDLVGWAAGGMAYISGEPDREPLAPAGLQALHLAGLQTASATLFAVFHARPPSPTGSSSAGARPHGHPPPGRPRHRHAAPRRRHLALLLDDAAAAALGAHARAARHPGVDARPALGRPRDAPRAP
jgi:hypothetical protein